MALTPPLHSSPDTAFASATAAIYYPLSGEVSLLTRDNLESAREILSQRARAQGFHRLDRAGGIDPGLEALVRSSGVSSLRTFLEALPTSSEGKSAGSEPPFLAKAPAIKDGASFASAAEPPKRLPVTKSATLDYFYVFDDFEGDVWAYWSRSDDSGGAYKWGVKACDAYSGDYSADALRAGSLGALVGCNDPYPGPVDAFMYAEACEVIQQDWKAFLELKFKASIDEDRNDTFGVYFGEGPGERYGLVFWGTWSEWYSLVFNLRQWPFLGDLASNLCNTVWLNFESNTNSGPGYGARVDDFYIYYGDTVGSYECAIIADPESGPAPLTVAFRGSTDMYSADFYWWFDDGTNSQERDPGHLFESPGDYHVGLSVAGGYRDVCYAYKKIHVTQGTCTYSLNPTVR